LQALDEVLVRGVREQILFIAAAGDNGTNNDRRLPPTRPARHGGRRGLQGVDCGPLPSAK
jgi:hypothetical protein